MLPRIPRRARGDEGQDAIEYGLLGSFLSIVAIIALQAIGPLVFDLCDTIKKNLAQ